MNDETKEVMHRYAVLRDVNAGLEAKMNFLVDNLKQQDEYTNLQTWWMINKKSLSELEASIREAAIADYKVTGNKKPWDGVGIKEMTKYDYELAGAIKWAKENAPMVVFETVDKKKFEKILSVTDPKTLPEYIRVYKEPTATIASDLSMYMENKDES